MVAYRDMGYLPEALLNYLVRLGWSHGDQEIFAVDELIELFDIEKVNKSASTFNPEKLLWLNQQYLKNDTPERIAHLLSVHMGDLGVDPAIDPPLEQVVESQQERAKTLVEMAQNSVFFYRDFEAFDEKAARKNLKAGSQEPPQLIRDGLAALSSWTP